MKPSAVVFAVLLLLILAATPASAQQSGEGVELGRASALVGEHVSLTIRVLSPADSTVELIPGTDSWNGVELVRAGRPTSEPRGSELLWTIEAAVAGFVPGQTAFAPAVAITSGTDVVSRTLEPVNLTVASVLAPDAPLVLRPLAPPVEIAGGESPWLRPGIVAAVAGLALVALLLMLVMWRLLRRSLRRAGGEPVLMPIARDEDGLESAERVLDSDPVAAYRLMSSVVKSELAKRYGLRATALTTAELRNRLENAGADRWEARLVGGLLEECDAVIYAGYRPALERRAADLTMAREIVEVG